MWLCALSFFLIVSFLWRYKNVPKLQGIYSQDLGSWFYVKWHFVAFCLWLIKCFRRYRRLGRLDEERKQNVLPITVKDDQTSTLSFVSSDKHGNIVSINFRRHSGLKAEIGLIVRLADGRVLSHPLQPDCLTVDETPSADEADENYIAGGGIRIRAIDPVTKYRLLYAGLMKLDNKFVHVNIRLWFKVLTDPANFAIDYSPLMVASAIVVENNMFACLKRHLCSERLHVEQSGEMRGVIEIIGGDRQDVCMNGLRDYRISQVKDLENSQGFFNLCVRFESGLIFSLHGESERNLITHQVSGFVSYQTGYVYPITWSDFHLARLPFESNMPNRMSITIIAHGRVFELEIELLSTTRKTLLAGNVGSSSCVVYENLVEVTLNGSSGFGAIEFSNSGEKLLSSNQSLHLALPHVSLEQPLPFCTQLSDPVCRATCLTGGKAAKLADIVAALKSEGEQQIDLKVPDGFAVTVAAYDSHLKEQPHLATLIKQVLDLAYSLNKSKEKQTIDVKLQQSCQELHEAFMNSSISEKLQHEIEESMKKAFGDADWATTKTAVRSSAVGEDGTEASGAGQMETFLGKAGIDEVTKAIKKCWASQFSFRAIQYRRQLCAKLDTSMAVLVQRIVDAHVAGVIFTRHPDTGSTCHSLINASYGIGESVVSGQVQPDTISVYRATPNSNDVRIAYDVIGDKAMVYSLDKKDNVFVESDKNGQLLCCLTEAEIQRLHKVGGFIEKIFRSGRDVEFAVKKDAATVYILQARPITTADNEEEWELMREFDTPMPTDQEYLTTANLQEMIPGAVTPLSGNFFIHALSASMEYFQMEIFVKPKRRLDLWRTTSMYCQNIFLNLTIFGVGMWHSVNLKAASMAMFGRLLERPTSDHYIEQNDMSSPFWRYLLLGHLFGRPLFPRNAIRKMAPKVDNYRVPETTNPVQLFNHLKKDLYPFAQKVFIEHIVITFSATYLQTFMMIIMDKEFHWGPQIYEDMSMLLSSCTDVFSADVPTQLQELAISIKGDKASVELFLKMDRTEAAKWLLSPNSREHGALFKKLLAKHGHRCVRDVDIREKSWRQEPEKLIDALKVMVSSNLKPAQQKTPISLEQAMDAIKTPLGKVDRFLLKLILKKVRDLVGTREWTKSTGVKAIDNVRRAYYRLATLLTEQGFLPDEDLIFFFMPDELEQLLQKRSPKLLSKALRRRKLFTKFVNLQFPILESGYPQPISASSAEPKNESENSTLKFKGSAVGNGSTEGVARVVTSLAEANKIQQDDILIVPFTDVGWTPYFPMISGLVTELGGLISHGAVVAREYGLPCIVGVKRATELIKTGDRVQIDGPRGEVTVLS